MLRHPVILARRGQAAHDDDLRAGLLVQRIVRMHARIGRTVKVAHGRLRRRKAAWRAQAALLQRQLAQQLDMDLHLVDAGANAATDVGARQHGQQMQVDLPGQLAHHEFRRNATARISEREKRCLVHCDQPANRLASIHGHAGLPQHQPRIDGALARMAGLRDATLLIHARGRALGHVVQQCGEEHDFALLHVQHGIPGIGQQLLHRERQGLLQPARLGGRQLHGTDGHRLHRQDQAPGPGGSRHRLAERQMTADIAIDAPDRQVGRRPGACAGRKKQGEQTHSSDSSTGMGARPSCPRSRAIRRTRPSLPRCR